MLKKYSITKFGLILSFMLSYVVSIAQNVGINSTGTAPHVSAGLDVDFTDRGFLAPRLTLSQKTALSSTATKGLLIYQTDGIEGFYYYNGSGWAYLTTSATSSWALTGNSGNSTNFLGTSNAFGIRFKTNNAHRMYIDSIGSIAIGASPVFSTIAREKLLVDAGTTTSFNVISGKGTIDSYLQLNIQNKSTGTSASADIVASNASATDANDNYYIDMGINSNTYTKNDNPILNGFSTAYLYNKGGDLAIGSATSGKALKIFTGGTATSNERITVNSDGKIDLLGNIGIGTKAIDQSSIYVDGGNISSSLTTGLGSLLFMEAERNQFLEMNIQNTSSGNDASSDIVATADNGTDSTGYINMGINSSGYRTNTGAGRLLNGPNKAYIYSTGKEFYIGNSTDQMPIIFFTNNSSYGTSEDAAGTERMRLNAAGELQIGSATDRGNYKLQVTGDVYTDYISYDGSFNRSDRRLKTNIEPLTYGLNKILNLNPVSYNWTKNKNSDKQLGLLAQEVREIVPEIVRGDESKEMLAVNYTALVPVLINAIKEQQQQIEALKKSDQENKELLQKLSKLLSQDK